MDRRRAGEHVRGEFSTYSWLLDAMLERTGFEILERSFRRSVYGTYTCRLRRERGDRVLMAIQCLWEY